MSQTQARDTFKLPKISAHRIIGPQEPEIGVHQRMTHRYHQPTASILTLHNHRLSTRHHHSPVNVADTAPKVVMLLLQEKR